MKQPSLPGPRDSRLEQFSTAAAEIIFSEKGLSPIARLKIQSLAKQKHLSDDQLSQCLNNIGHRSIPWETVGRYEQIFIDRLRKELPQDGASILTPAMEQAAITLAVNQYQIPADRAHQLLGHIVDQIGISRVSLADAKAQLRSLIIEDLEGQTDHQPQVTDGVKRVARNFGIDDADVQTIADQEFEFLRRQTVRVRRWATGIAIATGLIVLGVIGTAMWPTATQMSTPALSLTTARHQAETSQSMPPDQTANPVVRNGPKTNDSVSAGVVEPGIAEPGIVEPGIDADVIAGQNRQVPASTAGAENAFDAAQLLDAVILTNTGPPAESADRFQRWRQRLLALIGDQTLKQRTAPPPRKSSFADSKQKISAIAALRSPATPDRKLEDALERLSALTESIEDVSREEAQRLSRFVLNPPSEALKLSIQTEIARFVRWPRFLFALSDAIREDERISPWHQRIVFSLTGGQEVAEESLWQAVFELGVLAIKERRLAIAGNDDADRRHSQSQKRSRSRRESRLRRLIFELVTTHIADRSHRNYFVRLIDRRDPLAGRLSREIVLQQILIDALGCVHSDDQSQRLISDHGTRICSASTVGQQLIIAQTTVRKLSTVCLKHLQSGSLFTADKELISAVEGRALRDRAETIVIRGGDRKLAAENYLAALDCPDLAIVRSSLKGLNGMIADESKRRIIQRRIDFIDGGILGPGKFAGKPEQDLALSPASLRTLVDACRAIRSGTPPDLSSQVWQKQDDLEKAIGLLWAKADALSNEELEFIVELESIANFAKTPGAKTFASLTFPRSIEPELSAVAIVPLFLSRQGMTTVIEFD